MRKSTHQSARMKRNMQHDAPCPICGKPVRMLYSAILYENSDTPAHFDCIVKSIRETYDVSPREKICYLGSGSFGIIQMRDVGSQIPFLIRKRIQYENQEKTREWRKKLSVKNDFSVR